MNNFTIKDGNYYVLGDGMGDDINPGTIDAPRATFGSSSDINNKICILSGTVEQDIAAAVSTTLIGDTDARIKGTLNAVSGIGNNSVVLRNITVDSVNTSAVDMSNVQTALKSAVATLGGAYTNKGCSNSVLILYNCVYLGTETEIWRNLTVKGFSNGGKMPSIIYDSICYGFFDLYNFNNQWSFVPIFKYSIFLKNQTVFKWNGAIIPLTWTEPGNEKQDVIDSLKVYAAGISNESHRNYLLNIADNMFGVGTVVYDDSPGNIRLFNGYDSDGNPSDLNLNMQNGNPALFTSKEGDYVGARRPAFTIAWDWTNMQSIDENGNAIDETPDLLSENNGIFVNIYSTQKRNRVKATQVLAFPAGDKLSKISADFDSAASQGIFLGAWQNDVPGIVPLDALEADVYDTLTQPSAYPHLLIPFNKNLEIAYFKTGEKAGQPVLFSDLEGLGVASNKNLTEVAGWAITSGTLEFYDVYGLENVEVRKPQFRYILPVLTANRYS